MHTHLQQLTVKHLPSFLYWLWQSNSSWCRWYCSLLCWWFWPFSYWEKTIQIIWIDLILSDLDEPFRFVYHIESLLANWHVVQKQLPSVLLVKCFPSWWWHLALSYKTASSCILPQVKAFMGLLKAESHMNNMSQAIYLSHEITSEVRRLVAVLGLYLLLLLPLSALSFPLFFFLSLYSCQQLSHVVVFLLRESEGSLCHLQSTQHHVIGVTVCSSYNTLRNTREQSTEDLKVKRYAMHSG